VLSNGKFFIINVQRDGLYLLAVVTGEIAPLLVIEFLHRVLQIFQDYFAEVNENTIKDNFSTVYQILEEMMDNGYPLTTEPNALKAMIEPPSVIGRLTAVATGKSSVSDVLPDGTLSNIPWRKMGVKYAQNEIYFDIIEEVDAIIEPNGMILSVDTLGSIQSNSRLSGIPDLTMMFEDPSIIDDCSFHPCVRYNRFETDKVVSFVPPDGNFELMRYRVHCTSFSAPIFCTPNVWYGDSNQNYGRIELAIGLKPDHSLIVPKKKSLTLEEVVVSIPFPKSVRTTNLSVSSGACLYDEATKVAKWTIGKLSKGQTITLTGTMVLIGSKPEDSPAVNISWKATMASISGLNISSLRMTNETYQLFKGVRVITKSGNFQVRTT